MKENGSVIEGYVSDERVPYISIDVAGSTFPAIVDSGFNGDLDLPRTLQSRLPVQPAGEVTSMLAGGTSITQEIFQFEFLFDGKVHKVYATFSNVDEALLGTRLLREHRLEINFPARTLWLERIE